MLRFSPLKSCKIFLSTARDLAVMSCCLLSISFCGNVAFAESEEKLSLSGFASIGAGRINHSDATIMDYTDEWSFRSDSIVGGQAQYRLSDHLSATTQLVARGFSFDGTDEFDPVVEWLFLTYRWSPETSFRLGRMRAPLYFLSDSLEIAYSYPWVRPPINTYTFALSTISIFDGVDFSTIIELESADLEIQLYIGATKREYLEVEFDVNPLMGGALTTHWDNIILRYGITLANAKPSSELFDAAAIGFSGLGVFYPIFEEISEEYQVESSWAQYHSLGLRWDEGNWSIGGETFAIVSDKKGFASDSIGFYLSFSRQIERFSPYLVFGYYKSEFNDVLETLIEESKAFPPDGIPEGLNAELDEARAYTLRVVDSLSQQGRSYTLGVRYDVFSNTAIKFEVQYFDSTSQLTSVSEISSTEAIVLTSMVIDVVF